MTMEDHGQVQDVFIGRQPIYNDNLGVYAYALLFRSQHTALKSIDDDQATAQVVTDAFVELGIDKVVGRSRAAVIATESLLKAVPSLPVDGERLILVVPRFAQITEGYVRSIRSLSDKGYEIAIDDFVDNPNFQSLSDLANIIRVDVRAIEPSKIKSRVKKLKKLGKRILALKVETLEEYEHNLDIGFDFSQGFFLSRPKIIKTTKLSDNKLTIVKLLSVLYSRQSETTEIARVVSEDVSLSYKLLKLINTPYFGLAREVTSINQAVVMLGRKALQAWISMLALSNIDGKPAELTRIAMVRAKMCELLAVQAKQPEEDGYFTVGMFSALELLLNRPLANLVKPLPLSDEIKAAVLHRVGDMGEALSCTLAYEQSQWEKVSFKNLSPNSLADTYIQALDWTNGIIGSMEVEHDSGSTRSHQARRVVR